MLRFIKWIKKFFRTPIDRIPPIGDWIPEPDSIVADVKPEKVDLNFKGVLLFVGHTEDHGGMSTYNRISEQKSNSVTAKKIAEDWFDNTLSKHVALEVRHRRYSNYSKHCRWSRDEVKDFSKDLNCKGDEIICIELHYNASSGSRMPKGGYFMVSKNAKNVAEIAKNIIDYFVDETTITYRKEYRGMKGVKGVSSGRGSGWVMKVASTGAAALLFEPFYGHVKSEETEWLFGSEDRLHTKDRIKRMDEIAVKMSKLWIGALEKVINA